MSACGTSRDKAAHHKSGLLRPGNAPKCVSLPVKLERELRLARGRGSAGDGAGGSGQAGGSEDNQIGRIEVGTVEQVEDFRAKLQAEAPPKG